MSPTMSPAVTILIKGKSRRSAYPVPKSTGLKTLVKGVARKNRKCVGRQATRDPKIRRIVMDNLTKDIQKEMTAVCSKKNNSILRQSSVEECSKFSWEAVTAELQQVAPTLYACLKGCTDVKRRPRQKAQTTKKKMKRCQHPSNSAVLGVCASILLRHKCLHMNTFQRILSLILHSGHSAKQVYSKLQKLLLCLSRQSTLRYLDHVGEGHDEEVLQWRAIIEDKMKPHDTTDIAITSTGESSSTITSRVRPLPYLQNEETGEMRESSSSGNDSSSESNSSSFSLSADHLSEASITTPSLSELSTTESSSSSLSFLGPSRPTCISAPSMPTPKLVGDNIDMNVKPRDMRSEHQTRSLHYFNTYAVQDRVDLSEISDQKPAPDPATIKADDLLPTSQDKTELLKNFAILIARTLKKYMPFFKEFGKGLERHIRHEFYEEMSQKSNVVPLGILLKSEENHEEMIAVMSHMQNYVLTESTKETVTLPDCTTEVNNDKFFKLLLGGDQKTSARVRGSQRVRSNSDRGIDRLQGLVGVTEDWHTKMCFLGCASGMDGGTMFQLRNLINRRNVVKDPSNNMNSCEDFFSLVVEAHILAAAMAVFKMESLDDKPHDTSLFPEGSFKLNSLRRRRILLLAVEKVIDEYVDITYGKPKEQRCCDDRVQACASDLLSLGLVYFEFLDGIREGDGTRIIRCWKYLLMIFKSTGRTNYSIEALTVLAQEKYLFSPRMAM